MRHISLMSMCISHSAAHAIAMVVQASIIAIVPAISMAAGRIIMRIMVLLMSAMFMHMAPHFSMPAMPIALAAHIVQACSHAALASMRFCMADMSMPSIIDVFIVIMFMSMWSLPGLKAVVVLRNITREGVPCEG